MSGLTIPRNWTFSSNDVAGGFDAHVRAELPWYELASNMVAHLARHYIPTNGLVYDIGASTGNFARLLESEITARGSEFVGIERSAEMVAAYNAPFEIHESDAIAYDFQAHDLSILFLTMMFLPVHTRAQWLQSLIKKTRKGGALIIFDKCESEGGFLSTAIYRMTLNEKIRAGVEPTNVINKELSLSGFQRPIRTGEIPSNAREVFRFGDFAGWVVEV